MFGKRKTSLLLPTSERFDTLIGKTTEIYGRMVVGESLRIDGKLVGNIECEDNSKVTVAVGEDGEVVGDIFAYRVMIAGKVEGNIYATERVEFHQTAQVRGDVTYGSIGIEHGARVIGLVIQGTDKNSAIQASDVIREVKEKR
uniref:bactofilin family protein n=1 Tax=Polynucleobacter sp. TaxID=2029855 RepID=UPI004047F83F